MEYPKTNAAELEEKPQLKTMKKPQLKGLDESEVVLLNQSEIDEAKNYC